MKQELQSEFGAKMARLEANMLHIMRELEVVGNNVSELEL